MAMRGNHPGLVVPAAVGDCCASAADGDVDDDGDDADVDVSLKLLV